MEAERLPDHATIFCETQVCEWPAEWKIYTTDRERFFCSQCKECFEAGYQVRSTECEGSRDERPLHEVAAQCLFAQDASNLSGVVYGFSRDMRRLRRLYPDNGTEFFNRHPISVLYSDKIAFLTGSGGVNNFLKSLSAVQLIAKEVTTDA